MRRGPSCDDPRATSTASTISGTVITPPWPAMISTMSVRSCVMAGSRAQRSWSLLRICPTLARVTPSRPATSVWLGQRSRHRPHPRPLSRKERGD